MEGSGGAAAVMLAAADVEALTGRKRPSAQARQLAAMGIPFRRRTDGTIVVLLSDLDRGQTPEVRPTPPAVRIPAPRQVLPRRQGQMAPARE